jgi:hypothetical protein
MLFSCVACCTLGVAELLFVRISGSLGVDVQDNHVLIVASTVEDQSGQYPPPPQSLTPVENEGAMRLLAFPLVLKTNCGPLNPRTRSVQELASIGLKSTLHIIVRP